MVGRGERERKWGERLFAKWNLLRAYHGDIKR